MPYQASRPVQRSPDAAIASVRQADVAPKYRMLAATSRRTSSVPDRDEWLDDVPQPTPTFAAAQTDLGLPGDLI